MMKIPMTMKAAVMMMLEVGTNSYVTTQEADAYVAGVYPEISGSWISKTQEQKETILASACDDLDSLPFPGRSRPDQTLIFPRFPNQEVPGRIKSAQIEIAFLPIRQDALDDDERMEVEDAKRRAQLQQQGVKSFSIDDISETYETTGANSLLTEFTFLADQKIANLLRRYLRGSFSTC